MVERPQYLDRLDRKNIVSLEAPTSARKSINSPKSIGISKSREKWLRGGITLHYKGQISF
jgi:hypothetical protein